MSTDVASFIETLKELGFDFEFLSETAVANAPAGLSVDSGNAYEGALGDHCVLVYKIATKIAAMVATTLPVDKESLRKVCMLHQIAKAEMFVPNTEEWQRKKGQLYKFAETPGVLKVGERSTMLASNCGIKFTPEEYEAMRILDKTGEDYEKQKYSISTEFVTVRICSS